MGQIGRQQFLVATLMALAAPLAVHAQRTSTLPTPAESSPLVGLLMFGSPEPGRAIHERFREGLRALGYEEGRTLRIERRFTYNDHTRAPALARELLEQKPAVVLTSCGNTQKAIRELDRSVPIVAVCAEMKNFLGEVASLRHPGGATTGIFLLAPESAGKRVEILKELHPHLKRVGLLYGTSAGWGDGYFRENERAVALAGLTLLRLPIGRVEDLDGAIATARKEKADAIVSFFDEFTGPGSKRIIELALEYGLATASDSALFADQGGLFSYGADWSDLFYRVVPRQIDRILKGANPGDLPIEQPTKFTLVLNMKTAKALGLKIPQSLLLRADRVIE